MSNFFLKFVFNFTKVRFWLINLIRIDTNSDNLLKYKNFYIAKIV